MWVSMRSNTNVLWAGKRNCEFHERLRVSWRAERLSRFLRSTRETFVGLEVLCLYSNSKESRKNFVGAPFVHVEHVNLLLWHTVSFHILELWNLQIKCESIPTTDEIFGITILLLFIEFFDKKMRFNLSNWLIYVFFLICSCFGNYGIIFSWKKKQTGLWNTTRFTVV